MAGPGATAATTESITDNCTDNRTDNRNNNRNDDRNDDRSHNGDDSAAEDEPCTCFRCSVSAKDSIRMKRGDDERTAAVLMKTWKSGPWSKEFNFRKENATLGNLLGDFTTRDPRVRCAAQKIEHPTDTDMKLLVDLKPSAIILPKVTAASEACSTKKLLEAAELSANLSLSNKAALMCIDVVQSAAKQAINQLLALERQLTHVPSP